MLMLVILTDACVQITSTITRWDGPTLRLGLHVDIAMKAVCYEFKDQPKLPGSNLANFCIRNAPSTWTFYHISKAFDSTVMLFCCPAKLKKIIQVSIRALPLASDRRRDSRRLPLLASAHRVWAMVLFFLSE